MPNDAIGRGKDDVQRDEPGGLGYLRLGGCPFLSASRRGNATGIRVEWEESEGTREARPVGLGLRRLVGRRAGLHAGERSRAVRGWARRPSPSNEGHATESSVAAKLAPGATRGSNNEANAFRHELLHDGVEKRAHLEFLRIGYRQHPCEPHRSRLR